jgi:hypothetical protein
VLGHKLFCKSHCAAFPDFVPLYYSKTDLSTTPFRPSKKGTAHRPFPTV